MLQIQHTNVMGFEGAVRGARNPMNSWAKIDSFYGCTENGENKQCSMCPRFATHSCEAAFSNYVLGPNDNDLLTRLVLSGTDHSKFMRQIFVSVDITAPLFWWKEFDTYKVGTVANSCSTMHKIHSSDITLDDISIDQIEDEEDPRYIEAMEAVLEAVNYARKLFIETKDKKYWRYMIELLPSSYNQRRTVTLSYQVLRNIYFARRNHKLTEWHVLCDWIEKLPNSHLITAK